MKELVLLLVTKGIFNIEGVENEVYEEEPKENLMDDTFHSTLKLLFIIGYFNCLKE